MTVRDLIKGSLRLIGAISPGETPASVEEADALVALNDLLESWTVEGFLIYQTTREAFTLVGSQSNYTIGPSGTFNTTRPQSIQSATILDGTLEYPLEMITAKEYAEIKIKSTQSSIPQVLYASGSYPLDTLYLYPTPSIGNQIVLYSLKPISAFAAVSDVISMPSGFTRAIRYNLALDLAPEYGRDPSAIVAMTAQETKADLKRMKIEPQFMTSDVSSLTGKKTFNILTGE